MPEDAFTGQSRPSWEARDILAPSQWAVCRLWRRGTTGAETNDSRRSGCATKLIGWRVHPPKKTSPDPAAAEPPQPIASPTRPAGLPLMKTVPDPPERLCECGSAGQVPQAWGRRRGA